LKERGAVNIREQVIKVLLVEDDSFNAELIADTIYNEGLQAEIIRARNRSELIKKLKEYAFDIVLCDSTIPGLAEMEALRIVQTNDEDLPLIYLSNHSSERAGIDCLKEGAADFILKDQVHRLVPSMSRSVRTYRKIKGYRTSLQRLQSSGEENEKGLEMLFHQAPDAFYLRNPNGKVIDTNLAAERLIGYRKEEMIGKDFIELNLIPEGFQETFRRKIEQANRGESTRPEEFTILNKEGQETVVELTAYPLVYNNQESILGIVRDITRRKETEKRLKQSEEKFKALVKSTEDIIFLIDKQYILRGLYGKGLRKLGINQKDYQGKQITRLFDSKTTKVHIEALQKAFRGEFRVLSWRIPSPSGERYFQTSLSPIYDEKGVIHSLVGIGRDISEMHELMKELEEAKEKAEENDRLKSAFLANISHEIRTPMNGIVGFTQLLKNHDISQEKKEEFLEIIESRSHHLLQIINDIIDISKIEANQFDIQKKDTSIEAVLQQQIDFYSNLLRSKEKTHISLELEMNGLQEAIVHTDEVRLQQILSNLLDNAVKFTHQGSIRLGCRPYKKDRLLFYVSDTGIGIPKDKQHIVFESFRQVDESFTRTFEGTGLGLAITRKLVGILGGHIWLESEREQGSVFYFTIPSVGSHEEEQEGDQEEPAFPDLEGRTILVVEDDSFSRRYLQELIKPTRARIILAEDGTSAWKKILHDPSISIILMDIKLPDYNGLKLTQKVKESFPKIKVIAQTAYAMSSDKPRALAHGCDGYISKPVRQKHLFEVIEQNLN